MKKVARNCRCDASALAEYRRLCTPVHNRVHRKRPHFGRSGRRQPGEIEGIGRVDPDPEANTQDRYQTGRQPTRHSAASVARTVARAWPTGSPLVSRLLYPPQRHAVDHGRCLVTTRTIARPGRSVVILKATGSRHREVGKLAEQVSGPLRVLVESRREQVMAIAARHHASRVRLFGSAARGEDGPDSDVDLLVDFDQGSSLFDLIRMSRELEALLGRAVDVVSAGGLKSRDGAILAESVDL